MKLKDICKVDWGNTSLTKASYIDGGLFMAVSAAGCDGRINHYEHNEDVPVLSAIGAQCGRMFFPNEKFTAIKNTITLTPKENVIGKYIYYLFSSIDLPKRGAGQPFISKGDIENFEIPGIPSFAVQQKIVEKLDAIFEEIDKAIAATEGNVKNVDALFNRCCSYFLENYSFNCETRNIGEICDLMTGGTPSSKNENYYKGGAIPWLVSGDINLEEIIDCPGRITQLGYENSNAKYLPVNSVLIALNGQGKTRGTVAMLRIKATCNQSLVSILPKNQNQILSELIYYILKSRYLEIRKLTGDGGNDRRGLNMPLIRAIQITYPRDIKEQEKLVEILKLLTLNIKRLKKSYLNKVEEIQKIKKINTFSCI